MFMANGFDGFITKPIITNALHDILMEWLPADKIELKAKTLPDISDKKLTPEMSEDENFLNCLDTIKDINKEIGLGHACGIASMYRETLEYFNERIVTECRQMTEFIASADISGFAIKVHAMKSTLATVGANRMSEIAAKLEAAAKDNDHAFCREVYPQLNAQLLSLHGQLKALFPEVTSIEAKKPGDMNFLWEKMPEVLAAIDDFDGDAAIGVLEELSGYDFSEAVNLKLQDALTALKDFDLDGAMEVLKDL
jgi:HPt (histidine-containing phosphotransfer) domain-containing protein